MKYERVLEFSLGGSKIAAGGRKEGAATAGHDQDPWSLEGRPQPVELGEQRCGVVQLAETDLRLDCVTVEAEQCRLPQSALLDCCRKSAECSVSIAYVVERELEEAEDSEQLEAGGAAAEL